MTTGVLTSNYGTEVFESLKNASKAPHDDMVGGNGKEIEFLGSSTVTKNSMCCLTAFA